MIRDHFVNAARRCFLRAADYRHDYERWAYYMEQARRCLNAAIGHKSQRAVKVCFNKESQS